MPSEEQKIHVFDHAGITRYCRDTSAGASAAENSHEQCEDSADDPAPRSPYSKSTGIVKMLSSGLYG